MNKITLIFISLFALISMISCRTGNNSKGFKANSPESSVIEFLKFYNSHLGNVRDFRFVNEIKPNDSTDFYKINFAQTEKYLDLLSSSGYISDSYIKAQREYFKKCDLLYKKTHQNDGPPEDLDYDLIMFSNSDFEEQLAKLDSVKLIKSEINGKKAKVIIQFIYDDKKQYNLSFNDKIWQINLIENVMNK